MSLDACRYRKVCTIWYLFLLDSFIQPSVHITWPCPWATTLWLRWSFQRYMSSHLYLDGSCSKEQHHRLNFKNNIDIRTAYFVRIWKISCQSGAESQGLSTYEYNIMLTAHVPCHTYKMRSFRCASLIRWAELDSRTPKMRAASFRVISSSKPPS